MLDTDFVCSTHADASRNMMLTLQSTSNWVFIFLSLIFSYFCFLVAACGKSKSIASGQSKIRLAGTAQLDS